jgi:hypothetical protein
MAEKEAKTETSKKKSGLVAKKVHVLHWNHFHKDIKVGDDLSDVPPHLLVPLATEGVIDKDQVPADCEVPEEFRAKPAKK